MATLLQWVGDGTVFAWIGGLMLLEGIMLTLHARRSGRGMAPRDLWPNLLAGLGLLAAALAVSRQAPAALTGLLLTLALMAHLSDLALHWRR